MSEILNLSYGQYSNNITTHLYNYQESLIPYTNEQKQQQKNDLNIFLYRSLQQNKTVNYYPRSIIFELRSGLGSLNKYEYSESMPNYDMNIINKPSITKNEYQKSLDTGNSNSNLLNVTNTKYWTDFNKLIYDPKSLITTPNYIHNYNQFGSHYNIPNLKYELFENGVEEFKNCETEVDENFRYWLEKCDFLQGLQVGTNLNDSWGGFTNSMIEFVQDEFFNSKGNFWIYGNFLAKPKTSLSKISEIKTFLECYKNSNLFFPIAPNLDSPLIELNKDSVWQTSCIPSIFINSIWGLNNSKDDPIKMYEFSSLITKGDESKKIINEIKIVDDGDFNQPIDINSFDIDNFENLEPSINLGISSSQIEVKYYSKNIITNQIDMEIDETNIFNNPTITDILNVDTFPKVLKTRQFHVEFNIHSGIKTYLKDHKKFLQRVRSLNTDTKEEMIEDISNIISNYSTGFESEDDEFYD
ncbi:DML1 [Candida jiufengensis]|uniref:DML1 n=1 Tax=Candida jiufengensis TaxID=497108 RepID=UPI0022250A13|nr:DML1 [Candida jiufengensis]KAI5952693.1 DML1 [Candida jiufengensis]